MFLYYEGSNIVFRQNDKIFLGLIFVNFLNNFGSISKLRLFFKKSVQQQTTKLDNKAKDKP